MQAFILQFTPYRPLLVDQLKAHGLRFIVHSESVKYQRLADNATNLRLSGMMTETESYKVNKRMMRAIKKVVVRI